MAEIAVKLLLTTDHFALNRNDEIADEWWIESLFADSLYDLCQRVPGLCQNKTVEMAGLSSRLGRYNQKFRRNRQYRLSTGECGWNTVAHGNILFYFLVP
jgi:hypothetical protein